MEKRYMKTVLLVCILWACIGATYETDLSSTLLRENHHGPTSEGTLFAVAFLNNVPRDTGGEVSLYVMNNNPAATAQVEVSLPNNPTFPSYPQTVNIGPRERHEFRFSAGGTGNRDIRVVSDGNSNLNKGVRVRSLNNVSVAVVGSNSQVKSTDAFLALPCQKAITNEYKYFIFTADRGVGVHTSQFVVVACEDNTEMTYRYRDGSRTDGVTMSAFQTYGVSDNADITGAIVESNNPVAVFSGHRCGYIPADRTACDQVVEQIPMHAVLGNTFFTAPFGYRASGEFYRIGTLLSNNEVNITCSSRSGTGAATYSTTTRVLASPGDYYQLETARNPVGVPLTNYRRQFCCIETSQPAIVMQYMPGHSLDEVTVPDIGNGIGDPSISIIPPVEQYRSSFIATTIRAVGETFSNLATWTIPSAFFDPSNADEVLLDNKALRPGPISPLQGGSGAYIGIQCSNGEVCGYGAFSPIPVNGVFKLDFNSSKDPYAGINFNLYGYVGEMSYAYSAGYDMEPIGLPRITVYNLTVKEDVGTITIPFNRTGGDLSTNSRIFAQTRSVSGQAVENVDYTPVGRTRIRWRPGAIDPISTDNPFTVNILNDDESEPPEYFEVYFVVDVNGYPFPGVGFITILDDDGVDLIVNFDPISYTTDEGSNAVLTATLNSPAVDEVTVQVRTVPGTASDPSDYTGGTFTLTFPVGTSTASVPIPIQDDENNELTERFTAELFNPQGVTIGPSSTATVDIADNDDVVVMFDPDSYTVKEGESVMATVVLSRASVRPVSVDVTSLSGTATDSTDYASVRQTLTFQPGQTSMSFPVTAREDQLDEVQEQFTLSLSNPTNDAKLGQDSATVFIDDTNDLQVNFDPSTYSVNEGDDVSIVAMLNVPADRDVSVDFTTVPGSASEGTDYEAVTRTIVFRESEVIATVMVATNQDEIQEGTERFTATLTNPTSGLTVGPDDIATVNIIDDDMVSVQFDRPSYPVSEDEGPVNLTVILTKSSADRVFVDIQTSDDSADSSDYTPVTRTLTFEPGETSKVVPVPITNDNINEREETFTATLSNPQGAMLGPRDTASVDIEDDDPLTIQFNPTVYTGNEGDNVPLIAVLNRPADREITVAVETQDDSATSPDDYSSTSVVLTFPAGVQTATVPVPIVDDGINERPESFTATLSDPSGGATLGSNSTATINIPNPRPLVVDFAPDTYTVMEGDSVMVSLVLDSPADREVSVDVTLNPGSATAGDDYVVQTYTVTFPAETTSQSITVMTAQDSLNEGPEDFTATLSNPVGDNFSVGPTNTATVNINDDDAITVNFDPTSYTVDEGDTTGINVVLSNPSTSTVTVEVVTIEGTATRSDYEEITTQVTFLPGETSKIVDVRTTEDMVDETDEVFSVILRNPTEDAQLGPDSQADVTIIDDDVVILQLDQSSYSVTEGDDVVIGIVADRVPAMDVTVTVETSDGTATSPADYTSTTQVVTIPRGQTSTLLRVPTTDDTVSEQTESFNVRLRDPSTGAILGPVSSAVAQIRDDDDITINIEEKDYVVVENEGPVEVCIELTNPADRDIVVTGRAVPLASPEAQDGADFRGRELEFNIPAGSVRACASIDVIDDDIVEGTEKFEVILDPPVSPLNPRLGDRSRVEVSIEDDDSFTANIEQPTYRVRENETSVEVCATLSNPSSQPITVSASTKPTSPPEALAGEDYVSETIMFMFGAGETRACSRVRIVDNDITEPPEDFLIEIDPPTTPDGPAPGPRSVSTVTIEDDDDLVVDFDKEIYRIPENEGPLEVCAVLNNAASEDVTVIAQVRESNIPDARAGEDFIAESVPITFKAGETKACGNISIVNDNVREDEIERLTVDIQVPSQPLDPRPGPLSSVPVEIVDDDSVSVRYVDDSPVVDEDNGTVTICLERLGASDEDIPITVRAQESSPPDAIAGEDFEATTSTVIIRSDESVVCISIPIIDDDIVMEPNRTFILTVDPPRGVLPPGRGRVIIQDNDVVNVTWEMPMVVTPENSGTRKVCFMTDKESFASYSVTVTSEGAISDPAQFNIDYSTSLRDVVVPIPAGPAGRYCVDVIIVDDNVAQEGNESFILKFKHLPPGVSVGPIPETSVVIVDNDVVTVDFLTPNVTVNEEDGKATVCIVRSATTEEAMTVNVTTNFGSADGSDIESVTKAVEFAPSENVSCVEILVKDDQDPEPQESFTVSIMPQMGLVVPEPTDPNGRAMVTIIDNDTPATTACIISDALMVSPFNARPSYQFRGTCEVIAVQSCNGSRPDFSVRVDYLSDTFDIGAVGVFKDGLRWVIREDRTVVTTSEEVPRISGNISMYAENQVEVTRGDNVVSIAVRDGIGLTLRREFTAEGSTIVISVAPDSSLVESCGICGTLQGVLLQPNGTIIPFNATLDEKQKFVSSYRVPVSDHFLRPVRAECAVVRNGSIIGDPLFTVPIGKGKLNLCYEVHGSSSTVFNMISDECVNVNAHYAAIGDLNVMDTIAIRAEGKSKTCRDIRVDLDNCRTSVSPMGGGSLVPLTSVLEQDGIYVRPMPQTRRVRISVPNCQNMQLAMYVTCEGATETQPAQLQLHISRGVNLRPTSHGLIAQFWNIPISVEPLPGSSVMYNVTFQPKDSPPRHVLGEYYERTWDNTKEPCLYVGNGQGGPYGARSDLDDSVIEGSYKNYRMEGLFSTDFSYAEWDSDCTAN